MLTAALLVALSVQDKGLIELRASEVVEFMVKHAKIKVVTSDGLQAMKISASAEALDPEHAYESGVKLLKSANLAVLAGAEPGIVEIVSAAVASKKVGRVHTSVDTLPKADEFCTLSIRLHLASPREIQMVLINLVTFPQNCLCSDGAQTVILSDYASNLRRLADVVKQMDVAQPFGSFRITVTILEASHAAEPSVPEAFKDMDLPKATGFTQFKRVGESVARFEFPAMRVAGPGKTPPPTEAVLRVSGPPPVRLEMGGSFRGDKGPGFERFTLLLERPDAPLGVLALQTKVEFRQDAWVLVGVAPTESQFTSLVVLARATAEK